MKLTIYKTDGKSSGKKAELNDSIFGIEPNETVLYEDVRRILANKRQGTAKTKERG
jgi:large subunit ribosomal protein L4